ncbi:hypothetical protein [Salmonella phage 100268_sal2]|uniref:Uncharacterized protein n=1 Tax=Salmonella phage 100268_sal2 TaxID=1813783 RepID=A0A192Y7B7_9CAUD|nr:hypothetical protein BOW73_gp183 [Salmonella phage 100268_sal2]ANM45558.1 hypothetical protein [Salmonella phage 100268_sal2]
MKHIVKYTESERGWGGESWYRPFDTEAEALMEVNDVNKDLPKDHVQHTTSKLSILVLRIRFPKVTSFK